MSLLSFQPAPRFKNLQNKIASVTIVAVVLAFVLVKSTFSANISLNNASAIEYGQGIAQATACSGGTNLTITPDEGFSNSTNSGSFYFTAITVSSIPVGCYGNDFIITGYDNSTNTPQFLYGSSFNSLVVYDNSGNFSAASNPTGVTVVTNSTSSFTATFTTPLALTSNVNKIGIQSQPDNSVATYSLGSTGPGGGTVYYTSTIGFTCGVNLASTCHYLEVAPNNWSTSSDPISGWVPSGINTCFASGSNSGTSDCMYNSIYTNTMGQTVSEQNSVKIGYGATNTARIETLAGNSCPGAFDSTLATCYSGGGKSDWFIPSKNELNELCKYERGQSSVSEATVCSSSGSLATGFTTSDYYASSSEDGAGYGWCQLFSTGNQAGGNKYQAIFYIRAIRAF